MLWWTLLVGNAAKYFDAPRDSDEHAGLRDTAWMGGHYVEGRYLLGMLISQNLFRVSNNTYIDELHRFISDRASTRAAAIFCTLTDAVWLMPFLRKLYDHETDYQPIKMTRNDRVERGIEFLLYHLDASTEDIATFLKTTEKQVLRLGDITAARKTIQLHRESAST